jgi:hypothetical protein
LLHGARRFRKIQSHILVGRKGHATGEWRVEDGE